MTDADKFEILEERIKKLEEIVMQLNEGMRLNAEGGIILAKDLEEVRQTVYSNKSMAGYH